MAYSISALEKREINFAPETVTEEVIQNIWVILNTLEYECPLARGLGLSAGFVDKPIHTAQALCTADVYDKIELYEPRAEVQTVEFINDYETGKVYAAVEVEIDNEYDNEEYSG